MFARVVHFVPVKVKLIDSSPSASRDATSAHIIIIVKTIVIIKFIENIFWLLLSLRLVVRDFLISLRQSMLQLSNDLFRTSIVLKHHRVLMLRGHHSILSEVIAQHG
jgi:hypothetical protein